MQASLHASESACERVCMRASLHAASPHESESVCERVCVLVTLRARGSASASGESRKYTKLLFQI